MGSHRSHLLMTVWPIAILVVLELFRLWPALGGATAFAASSPTSWLALTASTLVVAVSLIAYARGWAHLGPDPGAGPYRSEGCRRLQKLAGGIGWGLVLAHVALQWFMAYVAGPVSLSHYELLRGFLSRPLVLAFYLTGLAALGLFLSQGVAASVRAWGWAGQAKSSRWLEVGCTVAALMTISLAVNVLSHFVTGRAYWVQTQTANDTANVSGDAR